MHPDCAFRPRLPAADERALCEALVSEIGFGTIFLATPDGPRVAHTPLLSTGDGAVQFHLARGNALAAHLDGATAIALVTGPDAYVSPRWYADRQQVPTWNYVALELEGRCRRMDADGLTAMLETLTLRHEAQIPQGDPWRLSELEPAVLRGKLAGIVGFEMEIKAWRPTLKLSQNKSGDDRASVIAALEGQGSRALAELMRSLVP